MQEDGSCCRSFWIQEFLFRNKLDSTPVELNSSLMSTQDVNSSQQSSGFGADEHFALFPP